MADKGTEVVEDIANDPKTKSAVARLKGWGSSAVPPSVLATLVIGLHMRPRQPLALLLFPAPLFAATYFNLAGYPTAAGGLTAAWSGLYALTAMRRRQGLRGRFSVRGGVRGLAVGLGLVNAAAGGLVWLTGDFEKDERERKERNRWGIEE
ncbi:uncharacterized protein F5Z01DRAFT_656497 [Emericellopsis atlantica]|uniref:Altered inheritance of mitochondria protein 19 n=1 Tax=Emericellopsis atlantica TaxID=2614577 RepID=A0A9P7ZKK0_9HYPO|nr:uncharacterized protein F5Z01DRAFT_656497 [Emericellopsis atlantica]KAG9253705.1 hypothetical protein F5Z01DRAFT_656497 [Emericellopsis atlantica]